MRNIFQLQVVGLTVLGLACGATSRARPVTDAIVYGSDDRLDYFALPDPGPERLLAESMVVLVSSAVWKATGGDLARAPSWADAAGLCPGEPFADQPAAAFCSGVLVDWDLVLTADHCTRAYGVQDFRAVLGYYYAAPGRLAMGPEDDVPVAEILNEELDPAGTEARLDYAWLRLARPVGPPWRPAALYVAPSALQAGDPVISVGAGGGVPLKWDAGGRVQDARTTWSDYFVADSDNSGGSSGGGAFDGAGVLTGVTARGGTDFMTTASGCQTTVRQPDAALATEQFTYAFRAVAGLCDQQPSASSICRADCGPACRALPLPSAGCSVSTSPPNRGWSASLLLTAVLFRVRRRARGRAHSGARDATAFSGDAATGAAPRPAAAAAGS
jgi:hypothetical protein